MGEKWSGIVDEVLKYQCPWPGLVFLRIVILLGIFITKTVKIICRVRGFCVKNLDIVKINCRNNLLYPKI